MTAGYHHRMQDLVNEQLMIQQQIKALTSILEELKHHMKQMTVQRRAVQWQRRFGAIVGCFPVNNL